MLRKMKKIRVIDLHLDEFEEHLDRIIDNRLQKSLETIHSGEELLSRKQMKDRLGIAYSTLDEYSKTGILNSYRIGHRIYFKWSEIVNAAKKVNRY